MVLPFLLLVLLLVAARAWGAAAARVQFISPDEAALVAMLLRAGAWTAAAFLAVRLLDLLVWHGLVERRTGQPVPRLLRDVVAALVWLATMCLIAAKVFGWSMAGIATTSGVVVAVLGFALRDLLASLFAGLALNAERPYQIGDWIEVDPSPVARVVEIGWLTTRAITRDGTGLVLPNARLARSAFRNYSRPSTKFHDALVVTLDHDAAPERVERLLLAAAAEVDAIGPPLPPPDVRISEFGPRGIVWQLRYWLADYELSPDIRYRVQRAVLRHLHQTGLSLAYPKLDLFHAEMPPRNLELGWADEALLGRCELFRELEPSELAQLATAAQRHRLPAGAVLLREGDAGSSLFIVMEGVVEAWRESPDGIRQLLNTIGAGGMLGEFSLLTGEPRSATVIIKRDTLLLEIGRDAIASVLERRPDLANRLGRILAERQAQLKASSLVPPVYAPSAEETGFGQRIRAFFGL